MEEKTFREKHPVAYTAAMGACFIGAVALGVFVAPKVAGCISNALMKRDASPVVPDEGPEIVKNEKPEE